MGGLPCARCAPGIGFDVVAGVRAGDGTTGDGDDLGGGERQEWVHDSMVGAIEHYFKQSLLLSYKLNLWMPAGC